jgi:hypothetical protein
MGFAEVYLGAIVREYKSLLGPLYGVLEIAQWHPRAIKLLHDYSETIRLLGPWHNAKPVGSGYWFPGSIARYIHEAYRTGWRYDLRGTHMVYMVSPEPITPGSERDRCQGYT